MVYFSVTLPIPNSYKHVSPTTYSRNWFVIRKFYPHIWMFFLHFATIEHMESIINIELRRDTSENIKVFYALTGHVLRTVKFYYANCLYR